MLSIIFFANGPAPMETEHWYGLGTLATVLLAGAFFLVAWLNNGTRLMKRVDELTSRVFTLQDAQSNCKAENADLKAELRAQGVRIREMESRTGTAPASPIPGVVVADLKGVVRIFSPSLVPMLGWMPEEVEGRRIDVLVPAELLDAHREAFGKAAAAGMPGIDRPIITYALAKSGARVPVTIHLKSLKPEGLITAEIRQRASAPPAEK